MPTDFAIAATRAMLIGSTALLALAAVHDVATRTVPNWVSGVLLIAGFLMRCLSHQIVSGLSCALIIFVLLALCWRRGWMGGADVKLLAVSVLLVPPLLVLNVLLSVAVTGGLLAFLYLGMRLALRLFDRPSALPAKTRNAPLRGRAARFTTRVCRVEKRRIRRLESLPYASAIAVGTIFVIINTV